MGVRIAKGPRQLTALLGVLAAGAAWVPLGADQPATRRSRILERADATVVLHDTNALSDPDEGVTGVLLDDALTTDLPEDAAAQATTQSPDDVVYVLFTSGSTGEPKGVELTHRAVMNTINAVNEIVGLTADDRTLGLSSLEFDLSVHDMFGPLNVGGAVVTLTEQERRDAEAWIGLMTRHHVTQLYCVPPLLDMLLSSTSTTQLDKLRWCLLGGDWVTLDLPGRLRERAPHCRFAGLGGATKPPSTRPSSRLRTQKPSIRYGDRYPLAAHCPTCVPASLMMQDASDLTSRPVNTWCLDLALPVVTATMPK